MCPTAKQNIGELTFVGYGAHCNNYPVPYLTAACSLGMTAKEVDLFIARLDKVLLRAAKKKKKDTKCEE